MIQFFCQDETDVTAYLDRLRGYIKPRAQGSAFTEDYLREIEGHMRGIAVPQGLFIDKTVTGAPWRGQQRRPAWWSIAMSTPPSAIRIHPKRR